MNDKNFKELLDKVNGYLEVPKYFTINPERIYDIDQAVTVAHKLFGDMKMSLEDDPLELGSLTICIKGFDIVVRGKDEIELFTALISNADNFEIYASKGNNIEFNILFNHALTRITTK